MAVAHGALVRRYEPKGRNWVKLIINSFFALLFGGALATILALTVMNIQTWAPFGLITAGVAVPVILWMYFTVSKPPPAFELYENGGALVGKGGTPQLSFTWDEVKDIAPQTYRQGAGTTAGAAAGGMVGALIGGAIDEAVANSNIDIKQINLTLPNKTLILNARYQDAALICANVRRAAIQSWTDEALRQIKNGQTVTFGINGKVSATHTGLQYKQNAISWNDIRTSRVEENAGGYFVVIEYAQAGKSRNQTLREPMGYKGEVLLAVINAMQA